MSSGRSAREEAEYWRYHYPNNDPNSPDVLINKAGIQNVRALEDYERTFVEERVRQGFPDSAHERSYEGYKAIHQHMFQDVYEWAGQERTYTSGRGPVPFAPPEHITPWMQKRFELLREENHLIGLNKDDFANRAAEHVNEINAAHPFIDGNGRTQRVWLRMVSDRAGYDLRLNPEDKDRWNDASRVGFERQEHAPMAQLLQERLEEQRNREQEQNRQAYIRAEQENQHAAPEEAQSREKYIRQQQEQADTEPDVQPSKDPQR